MRTIDIVKRANRNLRQAKGRTLLTALAISVGSFTLTLSLAIGAGTRNYFSKVMETNVNAQSLIVYKDKNLASVTGGDSGSLKEYDPNAASFGGGFTYKTLGAEDVQKLKANKDVGVVLPRYDVQIQYFQVDGSANKYTSPVAPYDTTIKGEAAAGSLPKLGGEISDQAIVIPATYLKTLGFKSAQSAIGKKLSLHVVRPQQQLSRDDVERILQTEGLAGLANATKEETEDIPYTIVAVAVKPATALQGKNELSISSTQAMRLSDYATKGTSRYQRYTAVTVLAKKGIDPANLRDRLKQQGFYAMTAKDIQGLLFKIVNVMQSIVAGFGILALLASVFGIINTQYISVLERTSQIGLMKALGMSDRAIGRLFRYEAAWIGLLGGVIGAVLALILGVIINPLITKQLQLGAGNILLIFQPLPIILLVLSLVLIAVLAGWFPSRKAAKLDPIEALRTE